MTLDAALARTEIHVPGAAVARATTGGGAVAIARRLTPHVTASARLEVARSFYAADVLGLAATPRWGATGFAVLEARVAR